MFRLGRIACTVVVLGWIATFAADREERIVYTRAEILEATTGEVEYRRAYTRRLVLPQADCDGAPFSCEEDRIYGQVYRMSYVEERVSPGDDGKAVVLREPRGQLLVAAEFSPDDEDSFETALRAQIEGLSVPNFSDPQAGMGYMREPISSLVLRRSLLPAYACRELDGKYTFDLVISVDGRMERTFAQGGDVARRTCRAIEEELADVPGEFFRTLPDVQAQIRHEVRFESATSLTGLTWADEIAQIPTEATFVKRSIDHLTGGSYDRRDGVFIGHEGRYHGVERDVRLPEADLDLVERPMWVSRWKILASRERFGAWRETSAEQSRSVVIAVVPITDSLMPALSREREPLSVPAEEVTSRSIHRLQRSAVLTIDQVEGALREASDAWPASGDWMVVSCRDDGTAWYGVAPFALVEKVTNPRATCAAIDTMIGN